MYMYILKNFGLNQFLPDTVLEEPEGGWFSLSSVPVHVLDIVVP